MRYAALRRAHAREEWGEEAALLMLQRLQAMAPLHVMEVIWGAMHLRRRFHLCDEPPPRDLTSSARAIVFKDGDVLVVRGTAGDTHIWPGGRREGGESLEETMRREVLEETGWALADARPFGIIHFTHLTERPVDYPYPYPDFRQAVFIAEAAEFRRGAIVRDGWEAGSELVPVPSALTQIDADLREILTKAIAARRRPSD